MIYQCKRVFLTNLSFSYVLQYTHFWRKFKVKRFSEPRFQLYFFHGLLTLWWDFIREKPNIIKVKKFVGNYLFLELTHTCSSSDLLNKQGLIQICKLFFKTKELPFLLGRLAAPFIWSLSAPSSWPIQLAHLAGAIMFFILEMCIAKKYKIILLWK